MNNFSKYRKGMIIKAVVIPLVVSVAFAAVLCLAVPKLEDAIPNGTATVQEVTYE